MSFPYSRVELTTQREGRLLGHIMIGLKTRAAIKIDAIPGFPPALATLVEHLILSHHGSLEFGSPSLPQTREAIALHFIDDMDSKMAAMRATLDTAADPCRLRRLERPESRAASRNLLNAQA